MFFAEKLKAKTNAYAIIDNDSLKYSWNSLLPLLFLNTLYTAIEAKITAVYKQAAIINFQTGF